MSASKKNNGHILVADDSLTVRMLLQESLEAEGYQVTLQPDGESCIGYLEKADCWPDLVLLDLIMPGVDGIEVLGWIKSCSEGAFLPVILLTSLGDVDDRVRGLDCGADDYMAKPFEPEELLARVRAQFRIKKLQDELASQNKALRATNEEKAALLDELAAKNKQLALMASTDALTNVANRRAIQETLDKELSRAIRYKEPLSVAMVDVDLFKAINDTHGHLFGDRVIRVVADLLSGVVRNVDSVGRYGGEEYLLILPDTGAKGAMSLTERICLESAALEIGDEGCRVTLSIGVAEWEEGINTWEALVSRADQALYQAKNTGRNRVCCWEPDMKGVKR